MVPDKKLEIFCSEFMNKSFTLKQPSPIEKLRKKVRPSKLMIKAGLNNVTRLYIFLPQEY